MEEATRRTLENRNIWKQEPAEEDTSECNWLSFYFSPRLAYTGCMVWNMLVRFDINQNVSGSLTTHWLHVHKRYLACKAQVPPNCGGLKLLWKKKNQQTNLLKTRKGLLKVGCALGLNWEHTDIGSTCHLLPQANIWISYCQIKSCVWREGNRWREMYAQQHGKFYFQFLKSRRMRKQQILNDKWLVEKRHLPWKAYKITLLLSLNSWASSVFCCKSLCPSESAWLV